LEDSNLPSPVEDSGIFVADTTAIVGNSLGQNQENHQPLSSSCLGSLSGGNEKCGSDAFASSAAEAGTGEW
jgi:hypothetical protein